MSIARRAEALLDGLSRHEQYPTKDRLRNAYILVDEFDNFDADDDYVVTNATAGTADVIDGAGGLLELDSASSTINQGVQVQRKVETILPASGVEILMEARVKWTDAVATLHTFLGLSVLDTTILAGAANTSTDHVGFESFADADLLFAGEKVGTRATVADAATMVEDTYIILGFFIDGVTNVTPLVNGVAGTPIETGSANIPIVELAPSFACHSSGATDPIMTVDWYYCVMTR
jgi:hypothetical protein